MFDTQKIADTYDQIALNFSATRPKLSAEVISLLPQLTSSASVLDLGCGNGVLLTALPAGTNYTGVDISSALLDQARISSEARSRQAGPNKPKFLLADINSDSTWADLGPLPAGRQEFDFIAALAVLHHLPTPTDHIKLLRNIKQHLNPGGICLISVWRLDQSKFDHFHTDTKHLSIPFHHGPARDFYAFTDDELSDLCRQTGFSQIKITKTKNNLYLSLVPEPPLDIIT